MVRATSRLATLVGHAAGYRIVGRKLERDIVIRCGSPKPKPGATATNPRLDMLDLVSVRIRSTDELVSAVWVIFRPSSRLVVNVKPPAASVVAFRSGICTPSPRRKTVAPRNGLPSGPITRPGTAKSPSRSRAFATGVHHRFCLHNRWGFRLAALARSSPA